MDAIRIDEGFIVALAFFPTPDGPVGRVFLVESFDQVKRLVKALILSGSLLSLGHLLKMGPEAIPSSSYLKGDSLDKTAWVDMEKTLPWEEPPKDEPPPPKDEPTKDEPTKSPEVAFVPILSRELSRVSAYTPDPSETDSDPDVAACGRYEDVIRSGLHVFAVSRDIFFHPELKRMFGKNAPLCGLPAVLRLKDGTELKGIIMDTMNRRFKSTLDILYHPSRHGGTLASAKRAALDFGVRDWGHLTIYAPVSILSTKQTSGTKDQDSLTSALTNFPEDLEKRGGGSVRGQ